MGGNNMQSSIPNLTNQLAQMQLHGGGNQYIVPTQAALGGAYNHTGSWHPHQSHPQQATLPIDAVSYITKNVSPWGRRKMSFVE